MSFAVRYYCLQVCAVGWEPNPTHTDHLRGLETAYNKCGWRVLINTATGVGARNQIGKVGKIAKIIHRLLPFTCLVRLLG